MNILHHANHTTDGSSLDFARDMWIFHYLLNGSNTKDVCRLRYSDLDFGISTFSFYRAKTENTETNATPISGYLHDRAKQIIANWGNSDKSGFVFPVCHKLAAFIRRNYPSFK